MNVLWITNNLFPAPSKALNLPIPFGGGWMYGLARLIAQSGAVKLSIASVYNGRGFKVLDIDGVKYYLLPKSASSYQKQLEPLWKKICTELAPDVIHIHGTEYTYGLACMRACPDLNYVITIQGLISVVARYYLGGITRSELFKIVTIKSFLRNGSLLKQQKNFEERGKFEIEMLKITRHIIGTSYWDYVHTRMINPDANYHFCYRVMRDTFYSAKKWDLGTKTDHTLFLSQAEYPLKGLHQALKAIFLLKAEFPDIKLRVAGRSIIKRDRLIQKIKVSEYGVYIARLIEKLDLHQHVVFTGVLSEEEMIREYQNAHLFLCSSSIENDSTSLAEAQIIGVPCVSAYVGGVEKSIVHGKSGFMYRFEETEMLAEYIRTIFIDHDLAKEFSEQGIIAASERHDPKKNLGRILEIYQKTLQHTNKW